jgi:hypothetical protein
MRCDIVRSTAGCALVLAGIMNTVPVFAQSAAPRPVPSAKAVFHTPKRSSVHLTTLPGSVCSDPRVRAAAAGTLSPITGVQSGTVIAIPLRKGPVDLKDATTRAQIARACAQH